MSTLKQLREMGAFATEALVQKEIKFQLDGQECSASIFVKRLSIGEQERIITQRADQQSGSALAIAEAVRLGEDGKERISFQEAFKLVPVIAIAMLNALSEVNGGGSEPKN